MNNVLIIVQMKKQMSMPSQNILKNRKEKKKVKNTLLKKMMKIIKKKIGNMTQVQKVQCLNNNNKMNKTQEILKLMSKQIKNVNKVKVIFINRRQKIREKKYKNNNMINRK